MELARRLHEAHDDEMSFLRRLHERARQAIRQVRREQSELRTAEYDVDGQRR
jgi:hypothetical protein